MSSPARYQYAEYERPLVGSLLQRQGLGGECRTGPAAAAAISSGVRVVMPYLVGWAIGRTYKQSSLLNMEDEGVAEGSLLKRSQELHFSYYMRYSVQI